MWMCFGALMPKRTRFRPTSRIVISTSSATTIFWSFLRLIMSIGVNSYLSEDRKRSAKNTRELWHFRVIHPSKTFIFLAQSRRLYMKKYVATTTALILLIFWPTMAQDSASIPPAPPPERIHSQFEDSYLKELSKRGRDLDSQGLYVESLDGSAIFADHRSDVAFNPASVIKIATSFS